MSRACTLSLDPTRLDSTRRGGKKGKKEKLPKRRSHVVSSPLLPSPWRHGLQRSAREARASRHLGEFWLFWFAASGGREEGKRREKSDEGREAATPTTTMTKRLFKPASHASCVFIVTAKAASSKHHLCMNSLGHKKLLQRPRRGSVRRRRFRVDGTKKEEKKTVFALRLFRKDGSHPSVAPRVPLGALSRLRRSALWAHFTPRLWG